MRHIAAVLCIFLSACSGAQDQSLSDHDSSIKNTALSADECNTLIRRQFHTTSIEALPATLKMFESCKSGTGFYKRPYFNCVLESKYSDPLECAYKANGIDRSLTNPVLKDRAVGDYGGIIVAVPIAFLAPYHGEDPHTTIDPIATNMYLEQRDLALKAAGETPPPATTAPLEKTASTIVSNGKTYWTVYESFADLQLVKVMLESSTVTQEVQCARFGSSEKLSISAGYCGALVKKQFNEVLGSSR